MDDEKNPLLHSLFILEKRFLSSNMIISIPETLIVWTQVTSPDGKWWTYLELVWRIGDVRFTGLEISFSFYEEMLK